MKLLILFVSLISCSFVSAQTGGGAIEVEALYDKIDKEEGRKKDQELGKREATRAKRRVK